MNNIGIIVLESNPISATTTKEILSRIGYKDVHTFSRVEDAIDIIDKNNISLAIIDISMEEGPTGIKASERIKQKVKIPVIYLIDKTDQETIAKMPREKIYGLIEKPVSPELLSFAIDRSIITHKTESSLDKKADYLQKENEIFFKILEGAPYGIIIVQDNIIRYSNPGIKKILGLRPDDIPTIYDFFQKLYPDAEYRKAIEDDWYKYRTNPGTKIYKACCTNGETRELEFRNLVIDDDRYVMIISDLSERKKIEEEIYRAEKLASIGSFAGGIAHEFNNLLMSIMGNISVAISMIENNSELRQTLVEAEKSSLRAKEIVQQLLTFSKGGSPIKKITTVDRILKDTSDFLIKDPRINIQFRIEDNLRESDIDIGQITQVFHNLLQNSIQSMPHGGTLTISASNIKIDYSNDTQMESGDYVKISIRDTGTGIDEKYMNKIFDPFFTTRQFGKGLGLSIAYSIIKNHNGLILVDSQLGKGSEFIVYLPAVERRTSFQKPEKGERRVLKGRVLVMDDEEMVLSVAGRMLRRLGFEVSYATNGDQAIELYKKHKENENAFDLVIMDLTIMGGMGGKDAIGILKGIDPAVKAIVSSGYSNDPLMANYREFGFCGVVAKPYRYEELEETIRNILI